LDAAFRRRNRRYFNAGPAISTNYTAIRFPALISASSLTADARHFQIATLTSLLALHVAWFDLGATPLQAAVTIAAALVTQYAFSRLPGAAAFDWRSPLITGLSLSLLLRTQSPLLWALAPALGIASKFLIRSGGKHFFNPATFAIVALLLLSGDVWVSPGQWGHSTWLVLLLVCAGGLVLQRAERADTALAFLGCYAGLLCWRAWSLGDPLAIPLNQLQSGALCCSRFMITDPRSTPTTGWAGPFAARWRSRLLATVSLAAAPRPVLRTRRDVAADPGDRPSASSDPLRVAPVASAHDF
jgi:Na+-transporting NADH:ubiquinone oxidoreductase subunit NqrB